MKPRRSHRTDSIRTEVVYVIRDLRAGGVERHAILTSAAVRSLGHPATIVTLEPAGFFEHAAKEANVRVVSLVDRHDGSLPLTFFRLLRTMRSLRPSIVMTTGMRADVVGRLVAFLVRADVVIGWKHNYGSIGTTGIRDRIIESILAPFTSVVVAVCYSQLEYLRRQTKLRTDKLQVVRNCVSSIGASSATERVRVRRLMSLDPNAFVVCVVAALRPEKDHETLISAFAKMAATADDVHLLVCGDGPERLRLERRVEELGLKSVVHFLGARSDIDEVLTASDLAVLASSNIECFPYALLEAMRARLPVVATAVGGVPELVDHGRTGLLCPPRQDQALFESMNLLRVDGEMRQRMGEAGRARVVELFSMENFSREIENLLAHQVATACRRRNGLLL